MSTMFLNDTQKGFTVGDRVIWSRHPELGVGKIEYIYKDYLVETYRKSAEFALKISQRTLDKVMKKVGYVLK